MEKLIKSKDSLITYELRSILSDVYQIKTILNFEDHQPILLVENKYYFDAIKIILIHFKRRHKESGDIIWFDTDQNELSMNHLRIANLTLTERFNYCAVGEEKQSALTTVMKTIDHTQNLHLQVGFHHQILVNTSLPNWQDLSKEEYKQFAMDLRKKDFSTFLQWRQEQLKQLFLNNGDLLSAFIEEITFTDFCGTKQPSKGLYKKS